MKPFLSVLMPAFNAGLFIDDAIESILNQSYHDFEFIIIDDGSTDNTAEKIKSFQKKDSRIIFVRISENKGLVHSLNAGLEMAKGKYIARMDADDISLPHRFKRQVDFMETNPDIGVSSSWMKTIGKKSTIWKNPETHNEILATLVFKNCIWHPVSIYRKEIIDQNNIRYDKNYLRAEDYHFWTQLIKYTKAANIPEILLWYRIHDNQETKKMRGEISDIRENFLITFLNRPINQKEKKLHKKLFSEEPVFDQNEYNAILNWVSYLKNEHAKNQFYVDPTFSNNLNKLLKNFKEKYFYQQLKNKRRYDPGVLKLFFLSQNKFYSIFDKKDMLKIILKSLLFYPNNYHHIND